MKEGIYDVKTTNYVFEMSVTLYKTLYTIQYGDPMNREGPCIEITYDSKRECVINLENVGYYPRCTKGPLMDRGEATREMLQSILKLCVEAFPACKKIVFKDVSNFDCDDGQVLLSYHHLLLYGQTWYEKHFGARLSDRDKRSTLEDFRKLLIQKPKKGIFSFYDGKNYDTWHVFFAKAKEIYGCSFFVKNKHTISRVANINLFYSVWYIKAETARNYDVTIRTKLTKKHEFNGGRSSCKLQRLSEDS